MTRSGVLRALASWEADPHGLHCDALCDAAEYLGLPEGEYQYDDLLGQVLDSDEAEGED